MLTERQKQIIEEVSVAHGDEGFVERVIRAFDKIGIEDNHTSQFVLRQVEVRYNREKAWPVKGLLVSPFGDKATATLSSDVLKPSSLTQAIEALMKLVNNWGEGGSQW